MSLDLVRQVLETRLLAMPSGLVLASTAFENMDIAPAIDAPFQQVTLLPAAPDNPVFGGGYVEVGILQVSLFYPLHGGVKAAQAQAELIRAWFPRGLSLPKSGVTTIVERTPEIGPGAVPDNMFQLPVRVRWYATVGL